MRNSVRHANLQLDHHQQNTKIQFLYGPDVLPVAEPTLSEHWRRHNLTRLHQIASYVVSKFTIHFCGRIPRNVWNAKCYPGPTGGSIPGPMKMVRNRRKRPSPINSRLATNIRVRWWLQLRIDFDSTVVRLKFDCNSTALRPFDELRYAWADALRPK